MAAPGFSDLAKTAMVDAVADSTYGAQINALLNLNVVDPGVATASKSLVLNASKGVDTLGVGTLTTTKGVASGSSLAIGGVISSAVGVAVHDSSSEAVSATCTIPANTIVAGTMIKVRGCIRATATVGTDTLQFLLRIGTTTLTGTALITSVATDVANADTGSFEFTLFGTAAASATSAICGWGSSIVMAGTTVLGAKLAPTNFATNGALIIECNLKWSTANANSGLVDWMTVEVY